MRLSPWGVCAAQNGRGYGIDEAGTADLSIASNSIGQRYKCLAFTLEMPFKDTEDRPDAEQVPNPPPPPSIAPRHFHRVPTDTTEQSSVPSQAEGRRHHSW